jgi:hypothetical protein
MFFSLSITSLEYSYQPGLRPTCVKAMRRLPNVERLPLTFDSPWNPAITDITSLFGALASFTMPKTARLVMPRLTNMYAFEVLSRLEHLERLSFHADLSTVVHRDGPLNVRSIGDSAGFKNLSSLTTMGTPSALIVDIFRNAKHFPNLRSLNLELDNRNRGLESYEVEAPAHRDAMACVASICPFLESLSLNFKGDADADFSIDFAAMGPVLTTLSLHTFSMVHQYPLSLSPDDAVRIAQACGSSIRPLTLNPACILPDDKYHA